MKKLILFFVSSLALFAQGTIYPGGGGGSGVTSVSTTAPITGGPITHTGTIGCQTASASQAGCLSSTDFSAFNGKQASGNYIIGLTGDVTVTGPGTVAAVVARINGTTVPTNSAADQLLRTTASAVASWAAIPDCDDTAGQHLNYDTTTHALSCGNSGGGGISITGTPSSGQATEWTGASSVQGVAVTGSGSYVKATSPTLVTPALGTPSAANLANATNIPGIQITGANSIPASTLPLSTTGAFGASKPDGTTITVSGGVYTAVGGSGFQSSGLLSARPGTCTVGSGIYQYFATDQPIGQQWYFCSATNTWTQFFLNDSTITNTAGTFGVDLNQFCRFTNSCTVAARWDFSGAASTSPNKKGLASAIPATCTIGDTYFETDATAGSNSFACTATNTWTLQGGSGSVTTHWVLATSSVTQTIPGSLSAANILYDTNDAATTNAALHSTSSNTQNFVPDATGFWQGNCEVSTADSTVSVKVIVFVNGTAIANAGGPSTPSGTGGWQVNVPWSFHLTSGDIVKCQAVSSTGFTSAAGAGTQFWMAQIH